MQNDGTDSFDSAYKKSGAGVVHRADSCDTVWFADSAGSAASVFCMAPLLIISMDTRLLIPESPPSRMASTPPCPIPYISAFGNPAISSSRTSWQSVFLSLQNRCSQSRVHIVKPWPALCVQSAELNDKTCSSCSNSMANSR